MWRALYQWALFVLNAGLLHKLVLTAQDSCEFRIYKEKGSIRSPRFPQLYPNQAECIWTITGPPGRYIKLMFGTFDVETFQEKDGSWICIDYVEVKDGGDADKHLLGGYCNSARPPRAIISSSNQIRVWFKTDETITRRGFNATFTSHIDQACGGVLRASGGVIRSPRYLISAYPNNMECEWVIEVTHGRYIRLDFLDFHLEEPVNCARGHKCHCPDTLTIWDGTSVNETRIGSYCGDIIEPVQSKTNRLRLKFVTDKEGRAKGFKAIYATSLTPGCGWDMEGSSSSRVKIQSPFYPSSYPAATECIWRIKAPPQQYISLRFVEFTGVNGTTPSCPMDHIEIKDGYSTGDATLARVCNLNKPGVIVSSGTQMRVHFQSSLSMASGKFIAVVRMHSRECNASLGLEEGDGRIEDTQLSASSYYVRRIGMAQFYHLPRFGRLEGSYAWCSQNQGSQMFDAGEYLQVNLRNLTKITAVSTQGYWDYVSNQEHLDYVTSYKIEYSFDGFYWVSYSDGSDNSTSRGYTEFMGNYDAQSVVKRTFKPPIIANMIRIIPTSYRSLMYHICLRAELHGCPYKIDCGGTISMKKPGKIVIRGHLRSGTHCTWVSMPSPPSILGLVLLLDFSKMFDVPCHMGYVQIEEEITGKVTRLCDQTSETTYAMRASHQLVMKVNLKKGTDNIGFDMLYSTESLGCGDIIDVSSDGVLTSPGFPSDYSTDQTCTWVLSANYGAQITTEFKEFHLQPVNNSDCMDYLEIRDGQLDTSPLLDSYCGSDAPPTFTSTANYMRIKFYSDKRVTSKGFKLKYEYLPPKDERLDDGSDLGDREERTTKGSSKTTECTIAIVLMGLLVAINV